MEVQPTPQLMPGGSLVTVPSPRPDFVTVNVTGKRSNCADTVLLVSIVTVQGPVPEQAPLQPTKVDPPAGSSVNVTVLPVGKLALHVFPQLMPVGALVTVPDPDPLFCIVRVDILMTLAVKTAVTF